MASVPALDLDWPSRPGTDHLDRLLAEIDEDGPTALEERATGVRVFFRSAGARARAAVRLIAADPLADCRPVDVDDEDWAARSQASLTAVRVGRIAVAPPWTPEATAPPPAGGVRIVIQPSTGFGTGHHPSTRACLRLLQTAPVAGAAVLDAGTGSGVLALAAAALGARAVVAIDDDPDAVTAAARNLALNGRTGAIALACVPIAGAAALEGAPFDLIAANLTAAALVRHAGELDGASARPGRLIAGGFEAEEAAGVAAAFAARGWRETERAEDAGWVGLTLHRPA